MIKTDKQILSTFEISALLGVHPQTVSGWARKGWLPSARTPGGHRRIHIDDLMRFLEWRRETAKVRRRGKDAPKVILVVEDDTSLREQLASEIQEHFPDLQVLTAADGYEAGRKLSQSVPSLVLLDLMMPGIDGFHVLRDMRADPRLKQCHTVVITGYYTRENGERALQAGADLVLTKPIGMAVICQLVRHFVVENRTAATLKVPLDNVAPFFET